MSETVETEIITDPAPTAVTMPGTILRAERQRQSLSVTDVARQLKLAPRQVEALERDDFAALPGPVFVRGFTRNYARMLGIEAEPLMRTVEGLLAPRKAEAADASVVPENTGRSGIAPMPESRAYGRRRGRGPLYIVSAIVILLAVVLAMRERSSPPLDAPVASSPPERAVPAAAPDFAPLPEAPRVGDTPPTTLDATQPAPANAAAAPDSRAAAATGPAPVVTPMDRPIGRGPAELQFSFSHDSWVEVRDRDSTVVFEQLNPQGSVRTVRGKPPLSVVIGNASNVTLMFNGKKVDLVPHTRTDVARLTLE